MKPCDASQDEDEDDSNQDDGGLRLQPEKSESGSPGLP